MAEPVPLFFEGMRFAIAGKLEEGKRRYKAQIVKHGGRVSKYMNARVHYLISNDEAVKGATQSKDMKRAFQHDKPIVREGWIGACIAESKVLNYKFFEIKVKKQKGKKEKKAKAALKAKAPKAKLPKVKKAALKKKAPKHRRVLAPRVAVGAPGVSHKVEVMEQSGMVDKAKVFENEAAVWDAELVFQERGRGKDKYFNMQLLVSTAEDGQYWVAQHWGLTGMPGRNLVEGPMSSIKAAKATFRARFRVKTGNVWPLTAAFVEKPNKYKLLARGDREAEEAELPEKDRGEGLWQYYLHNRVDGKAIGWYNYEARANTNLEKFWNVFRRNPGLELRFIKSDYFKYEVNFSEMTQCNQTSGMRRAIRRLAPSQKANPPRDAPEKIPEMGVPKKDGGDEEEDEEEHAEAEEEEENENEEEKNGEEKEADEDEAAAEEGEAEAAEPPAKKRRVAPSGPAEEETLA